MNSNDKDAHMDIISNQNNQSLIDDDKLSFVELQTNQDFKVKICLPYFKDIYKDLQERSDNSKKGINKVSILDYAQLPGVLGDRFFDVLDSDGNGYIDQREFLSGLFRIYCSTFDEKADFIFEIYDFDNDGFISKVDISTILASLPVVNLGQNNHINGNKEGKFTQEGGGLDNFEQRVKTIDEMNNILNMCFEGKQRIDPAGFRNMNEELSSDTVLAVLGLFRERLPCSENFWRYKRNYDLHIKMVGSGGNNAELDNQSQQSNGSTMKRIASPKMTHVRALSPYAQLKDE